MTATRNGLLALMLLCGCAGTVEEVDPAGETGGAAGGSSDAPPVRASQPARAQGGSTLELPAIVGAEAEGLVQRDATLPQAPPLSYDSQMAALGSATLDCLGTANPALYAVRDRRLSRTFAKCTLDPDALGTIDNLLAMQRAKKARGAAEFMTATWTRWARAFPHDEIAECPTWEKTAVLTPATLDNVGRLAPGQVGEENYVYRVRSTACGDDAACAVRHALRCAGGFGSRFLLGADERRSEVTVDPVYWLLNISYAEDENPFLLTADYYHGMCYRGSYPGDQFGAPNRAGEYCCRWLSAEYVAQNAVLMPIDCGGGLICMTMCM